MRLILSKYKVQIVCALALVWWAAMLGFALAMLGYRNQVHILKMDFAQQNALREQQYAQELQTVLQGCQR